MKFDKIKPSRHFEANQQTRIDRKDITVSLVEDVMKNPLEVRQGRNGRVEYVGTSPTLPDTVITIAVSATTSAGNSIGRVVTGYKDRRAKKRFTRARRDSKSAE